MKQYQRQAVKLATEILLGLMIQGDKRVSPQCKQFKFYCWLPHPQPDCKDCKWSKKEA